MSPAFVDNDGKLNWRKIGYHARSAFAVILSLAVLVGGAYFVYAKASDVWVSWRTADDYVGDGKDPVEVTIPNGATVTQIGDILVEHKVVKSTKKFREVASSAKIQVGKYKLKTELPAQKALDMMLNPINKVVLKITLPEGRTLGQQWTTISKASGVPRETLRTVLNTTELGLPAWANGKVEGFMFPDTYQVAEPLNAAQLFKSQAAQFAKVSTAVGIETKAAELGITPFQLVTVASMIEKEAARAEDRPLVASVIYNRLKAGQKLEFDSTVHYAIGVFNRVTTTAADRAVDSPYNTYRNAGLPPGAISNPGKAALEAAANPAESNYLFFTAVDLDSGETRFAATAAEHAANVQLFRAWCQSHKGRCT